MYKNPVFGIRFYRNKEKGNTKNREMKILQNDKKTLRFIEKRDKDQHFKENLFVNVAIQYLGRRLKRK